MGNSEGTVQTLSFNSSMCATIVNECLDSVNAIYQENDGLDYWHCSKSNPSHIYCFHNIFRSIPYSNSLLTNKMCSIECTFRSTYWATNCCKLSFKILKFYLHLIPCFYQSRRGATVVGCAVRRVPCVRATHPRLAGLAGLPRTSLLAVGTNIWCPQL